MKKAVFLDRDGVINKTLLKMGKQRAPYTLEEFAFIEGVEEAVLKLKAHGFTLIVVTNQPDVSRGWVTREAVDLVNDYIQQVLKLDDMVACFHTNDDNCDCRKPKPGMLTSSAAKWQIDLKKSFMVGDRTSDIEAGEQAGCKTVLVGDNEEGVGNKADHTSKTLLSAVDWIISL